MSDATATIEVTLTLEQIADTIRRLGRDGMQELLRLVPELRETEAPSSETAFSRQTLQELRAWYADQVEAVGPEYHAMGDSDPFLGGLTVREYLALSDEESRSLWDRLYAEELDKLENAEELNVPPDAVLAR
ncbi:MAG TPA: hypothetical protein ENJ31_06225 [Anaerolineae bacterium]|nr:hypothetical protein [Anaerolineae bacterium]